MENKELIGRKVRGFKFEPSSFLGYNHEMNNYIGKEGVICYYDLYNKSYRVNFDEEHWFYPDSEIEKHLVEENDCLAHANQHEQQIYDQDLLDKFALAALPSVIDRFGINLTHEAIAQHAYNIARAMMKERIIGA